jgi:glucose uptake protein
MVIIQSYPVAVMLLFVSMLCWGSWANTQKMSGRDWPFPLFYWDYALGLVMLSLVFGLTLGSIGELGRPFLADLRQGEAPALGSAFLGGVIFNIANLLVVAAIDIAGMAIAFPIAIGLALVIGVAVNYIGDAKGDPLLLFTGVALVVVAIVLNALAYRRASRQKQAAPTKGILVWAFSIASWPTRWPATFRRHKPASSPHTPPSLFSLWAYFYPISCGTVSSCTTPLAGGPFPTPIISG